MPDSRDSSAPTSLDTLSPPPPATRRFGDAHPYRTPSGRRRLLDERRQTSRTLAAAERAAADRKRLRAELAHLDELLRVRSERAIDRITLRTKCRERWDRMAPTESELGPDTVRRGDRCQRDVFDLSKMTEEEVEGLMQTPGRKPCVRLHRRSDGRVVTAPCPPREKGSALTRIGAAAGGALVASTLFSFAQLASLHAPAVPTHAPLLPRVTAPPPAPPVHAAAFQSVPDEDLDVSMGEPLEHSPRQAPQSRSLVREGDIRQLGSHLWQVRRALVDRVLDNMSSVQRTPRIIPHEENGRVVGLKIYGVRETNLFGMLGLENGDLLMTVNDHSFYEPSGPQATYSSLRRPPERVSLRLRRRGVEHVNVYRFIE